MVNLTSSKDNTLYEFDAAVGDRSNGAGIHLFAGRTDSGLIRRGAIAFDIAGNVPAGSTINNASLRLTMSRTSFDSAQNIGLYRLLADWGEGSSNANAEEGRGAPAATNDATWQHRFFSTTMWSTQGGSFSATLSANALVGAIGLYTWNSPQLTGDVQAWFNSPASNFGWLIAGGEGGNGTTKRFDTRESTSPPVLTIEYTPPAGLSQPGSVVSRKVHGGVSSYDINLPLTGRPGCESRSGGTTNDYQLVVTYAGNVSVTGSPQAAVTSGTGMIGSGGASNGGAVTVSGNVIIVPLTNVANAQTLNVTISGVNGSGNLVVPLGVLLGDANGDGLINSADVQLCRSRSGQTADPTNFSTDYNLDGLINAADTTIVRARSGQFIP